ncbi:MAG: PQQ-binding-like beta-propeller repeat protein [Gammaproteobacteria bacterium]|jgi:alcohol dehydrogenase (cytochrome c)|nr:PQQ-binding-like beta-propeller repeat protein [Gammaproteobacteria bacterium]
MLKRKIERRGKKLRKLEGRQLKRLMNFARGLLSIALSLSLLALPEIVTAQTVTFSEAQVQEGKQVYDLNCASCHGVNLEGAAVIPGLSDATFASKWSEAPLEQFARDLQRMPPGNQDAISEENYRQLVAYILSNNGVASVTDDETIDLGLQADLYLPQLIENSRVRNFVIAEGAAQILNNYTTVTQDMLLNPPEEDWLLWQGSYDNHGFSRLDKINRQTVTDLELSWRMPLQTGVNNPGPIVHDGVMYLFTFPDTVLAIDARNGALLWRYEYQSEVAASQKKGIALFGDTVYMPTSDLHVLALNARSGELEWDYEIKTDEKYEGYHLRMAPFIVGDTVIQGITSLRIPEGGWIEGIDRETGAQKWRFYTIPRPGEPGGNTWNGIPMEERSGGSVWNAGAYDPELNLVYFGVAPTYNTAPLLYPVNIDGITNDALYTNATIALNPDSGELVWHYQHIENDQWDLDWAFERQIINISFEGEKRKAVINMGKLGILDAVDAATGEFLFSMDMGLQNVVTAINPETGYKTINPYTIPQLEEQRLICSNHYGAKSWPPAAFNPISRKLFLPLNEGCLEVGPDGRYQILTTNIQMREALFPGSNGNMGRIQALDLDTQEFDWRHRQPSPVISSILATAGGIVFAGDLNRHFRAFDDDTGEILWEALLDDVPSSTIITYEIEGIQYVAIVAGQTGYHVNDWARMYGIFAEPEGMPVNDAPKGGAAIWVYALEH